MRSLPRYKFVLAIIDLLAINLAFSLAIVIRFSRYYFPEVLFTNDFRLFIFISFSWIFIFQSLNLYKRHIFLTAIEQFVLIFKGVTYAIFLMIVLSFFQKSNHILQSRLTTGYTWVFAIGLVSLGRIGIFRSLYPKFIKDQFFQRNILIVGAGEKGKKVAAGILSDEMSGLKIVGFLDDRVSKNAHVFAEYQVLGKVEDIETVYAETGFDEIIIAINAINHERLGQIIEICNRIDRPVHVSSELYQVVPAKLEVEKFSEIPLVKMPMHSAGDIDFLYKRFIDFFGSLVGILFFSPMIVLAGITIKLSSSGPILFSQKRIGKNGRPFHFYKFRTMHVDSDDTIHREYLTKFIKEKKAANEDGTFKIKNDPRVTWVGNLLRRYSLDEIPQLFNVLKGDMSLVGPRPCLTYEYEQYEPWHKKRLKVTPGLTGLWQVSGRSSVNFDDMVVLDLYYIENMSPWLDLQIMLKTIPVVLFGRGGH